MPYSNCIVVSDLHVGCQMGLMRPSGAKLDGGGKATPNRLQRKVWRWWREFWDEWVPSVTEGDPFVLVVNGDCLDGVHHGSTTQWSHNMEDQRRAAADILRPEVEKAAEYYHVRGTEAHSGQSCEHEEALARELGALPTMNNYARWELWKMIGRGLAHFSHHIGVPTTMRGEPTSPMNELSEAYALCGRWGGRPPDWIVRSHRHTSIEIRIPTRNNGRATVTTTPAWQLKTPFTYRCSGARQSQPQIGGILLRCGGDELYTRHFTKTLQRPRIEP